MMTTVPRPSPPAASMTRPRISPVVDCASATEAAVTIPTVISATAQYLRSTSLPNRRRFYYYRSNVLCTCSTCQVQN